MNQPITVSHDTQAGNSEVMPPHQTKWVPIDREDRQRARYRYTRSQPYRYPFPDLPCKNHRSSASTWEDRPLSYVHRSQRNLEPMPSSQLSARCRSPRSTYDRALFLHRTHRLQQARESTRPSSTQKQGISSPSGILRLQRALPSPKDRKRGRPASSCLRICESSGSTHRLHGQNSQHFFTLVIVNVPVDFIANLIESS